MKKLLAILGAFGLTATGATAVVACKNDKAETTYASVADAIKAQDVSIQVEPGAKVATLPDLLVGKLSTILAKVKLADGVTFEKTKLSIDKAKILYNGKAIVDSDLSAAKDLTVTLTFKYYTTEVKTKSGKIVFKEISKEDIAAAINKVTYTLDVKQGDKAADTIVKITADFIKAELSESFKAAFADNKLTGITINNGSSVLADGDLSKAGTVNATIKGKYDTVELSAKLTITVAAVIQVRDISKAQSTVNTDVTNLTVAASSNTVALTAAAVQADIDKNESSTILTALKKIISNPDLVVKDNLTVDVTKIYTDTTGTTDYADPTTPGNAYVKVSASNVLTGTVFVEVLIS